ncbi:reverse transcriptase domain-containing protein [Tanacetum coccineum]
MKATPRKPAYDDSDKETPAGSLAKGFSVRFLLESSGTSDTHKQTCSTIKSQKAPSKNKEPGHLNSKEDDNQNKGSVLEKETTSWKGHVAINYTKREPHARLLGIMLRRNHAELDSFLPTEDICYSQNSNFALPLKIKKAPSKIRRPGHLRGQEVGKTGSIPRKARRERYKTEREKDGPDTKRHTGFGVSDISEYEEGDRGDGRRAKLPQNIRVYKGNKYPEYPLGIFLADAEQEEWLMPIWCKMFRQTLGGATRNWFDDLNPKSVDSFEELIQKFLEEFLQQKRYAKDPTEIHGIKRRQNKGLQAFMDRFKSESSHIKEVPSVLRIFAFMHGHGHPELAKKLNDKIPKTVDEIFERVRAFIRGEVAVGKYTFTSLTKTPKEILAMESISFPEPPPLIGTPEKKNLNKFCDYHGDRGHNTNDCYQLKKKIEEAMASRKLAHLVKDIRQNNQQNGNP